jgi:membrane protease YdiL (CAAX protease family)
MDRLAELSLADLIVLWLGSWACFAAWFTAAWRLWHGRSPIAFERRRQVPWGGLDLSLVFAFFVISSTAMVVAVDFLLGPDAATPAPGADAETSHAIVQLFRDGNALTLLLCVVSAVCVAPVVEEFLFRVLLQGWLERLDRHPIPMVPKWFRLFPWSVAPVFLSSFIFAMVHFRVAKPPAAHEYLLWMMVGNSLVGISTTIFAVLLLWLKTGATAADLGFVAKKVPRDVGLGLAAAGGVILPIFIMQAVLNAVLPSWVAADPLPLFCFAVVLGTLYCRTHRLVASVVLHACLNAASLALLWFFMSG